MFGFALGLKTWIMISMAAIIAVGAWGTYRYITNLQTRVETMSGTIIVLEDALKTSEKTLSLKIKEIKANEKAARELNVELEEATTDRDNLRRLLADHDLTRLADEKPSLIEKRINDASNETIRDLERITDPRGLSDNSN